MKKIENAEKSTKPRRDGLNEIVSCFHDGIDDLVFWSFRYFLGRQTIATCQFAEELSKAFPLLNKRVKNLIRRELDRSFQEDDKARKNNEKFLPLGLDCDRQQWQKVREAYLADTGTRR